jgi:hypothetical protein
LNPNCIARLKQVFDYSPETGLFTWKEKTNRRIVVGSKAGSKHAAGYTVLCLDGVNVLAHRAAFAIVHGYWPDVVDHINRNTADDRACNLRAADKSLNAQNQDMSKTRGRFARGVTRDKSSGKFAAHITVRGKTKFLGRFPSVDAAHQAYISAKAVYHPGALQ